MRVWLTSEHVCICPQPTSAAMKNRHCAPGENSISSRMRYRLNGVGARCTCTHSPLLFVSITKWWSTTLRALTVLALVLVICNIVRCALSARIDEHKIIDYRAMHPKAFERMSRSSQQTQRSFMRFLCKMKIIYLLFSVFSAPLGQWRYFFR